jgi:ribosomal-protein-alanine N-acetyltransferase
MTEVV